MRQVGELQKPLGSKDNILEVVELPGQSDMQLGHAV